MQFTETTTRKAVMETADLESFKAFITANVAGLTPEQVNAVVSRTQQWLANNIPAEVDQGA